MKICKIENCNRDQYAKGFCRIHYRRAYKYGDPLYLKYEYHHMSTTTEYKLWSRMRNRCYETKNNRYKYYGGRGITVCKKWRDSFMAFFEDMGPRPFPKAQIDRIDNDGNYEPKNCKWATQTENIRHASGTKLSIKKAKEIRERYKKGNITLKNLAVMYGVHYSTIRRIIIYQTWLYEGI